MTNQQLSEMIENANQNGGSQFALMTTFADLMAILMCFFVLLYSLSAIDNQKFHDLSESLGVAFGATSNYNDDNQEQNTILDKLLNKYSQNYNFYPQPSKVYDNSTIAPEKEATEIEGFSDQSGEQKFNYTEKNTSVFKYLLQKEIGSHILNVRQQDSKIIITVASEYAFKPGSADLTPKISETLQKLARTLNGTPGRIIIAGYTDDTKIANSKYRSNWDLSAARAATLLMTLVEDYKLDQSRFHVEAYADNDNLVPNTSEANRAKNRRIEIMIDQTDFYTANPHLQPVNPNAPHSPHLAPVEE